MSVPVPQGIRNAFGLVEVGADLNQSAERHDAELSQLLVREGRDLLSLDHVLLEDVSVLAQTERIEPLTHITHGV